MDTLRILRRWVFLLAGIWLCTGLLRAQESVPTAGVDTAVSSIPTVEITSRSEKDLADLADVRRLVTDTSKISALDTLFPRYIATMKVSRERLRDTSQASGNLAYLRERLNEWTRLSEPLTNWQRALEKRANELEQTRLQLMEIRGQWELTRQKQTGEGLTPSLRSRVRLVLSEIADVQLLLERERARTLDLLKHVSDESLLVEKDILWLKDAILHYTSSLFVQDARPFWSLGEGAEETAQSISGNSTIAGRVQIVTEFVEANGPMFVLHACGALALAGLLWAIRRSLARSRTRAADQEPVPIPLVARRPFSTALFIALLISRLVYPKAPEQLFLTLGGLAVIPLLRLLPALLPRKYHQFVYALLGVYFLHRAENIISDLASIDRILQFGLAGLALLILLWFLKKVSAERQDALNSAKGWPIFFSWMGIGLLAIGIGANISGFLNLSGLILNGVLYSMYSLLLVAAGVVLLDEIVSVGLKTKTVRRLHVIQNHEQLIRARLTGMLKLTGVLVWLSSSLANFNLWMPLASVVLRELKRDWTVGTLTITLGSVFGLVLTVWLAALLSRLIRALLDEDILPRTELRVGVQSTISTLVYYALILIGIFFAASVVGMRWETLTIVLGAISVGIGFGLQSLVNNLISGLILMFERPLNVGDKIEFGARFGTLMKIGLRASTVRTFDGSEVIVPNSTLISSEVVNWTLSDQFRRMEVQVGVAYGTDPHKVITTLVEVARSHPEVMKDPAPFVMFLGFGDSSLDFKLMFWAIFDMGFTVRTEVMVAITRAFNERGIQIPFPQRDLHLKEVPGDRNGTVGVPATQRRRTQNPTRKPKR
jgi:potassium-dependent mechanosensitive channel